MSHAKDRQLEASPPSYSTAKWDGPQQARNIDSLISVVSGLAAAAASCDGIWHLSDAM
jgi:hypothetical protein